MTRPVRAGIDLQALRYNFSVARKKAAGSRVMAVVKADAYGHGLVPVARALGEADAFAVVSLDEAVQLRDAGIRQDILLLEGVFTEQELAASMHYKLQLVVHCEEQLRWLAQLPADNRPVVWLKVDTGMHRLGFAPQAARAAWHQARQLAVVKDGHQLRWMSHLCCADDPAHAANDAQLARFTELTGSGDVIRSMANSAALLTRPDAVFEWVRPGIMLYGASPLLSQVSTGVELRPVMSLQSRLIAVQQRRKGEALGYGQTWVCPEDMPVGVAAIGYGDGYPRHAPSGTPVLVNGTLAPLVGRVSMDTICVDLRNRPQACAGDEVLLWGRGLAVETIAEYAGTISYELFCGVTPRVPRIYS